MNKKKSDENKRQYERLRSYCLIRYNKMADAKPGSEKTTNVKNISEGGLMFTSYEYLPVDSTIKIMINFPGREEPVETVAKVKRCIKASESEEVYHVGILFLDITDPDRQQIHAHVEHARRDKNGKKLISKRRWWQFWLRKKIKSSPSHEDPA
ncbi:MAG: hypothetical protein UW91_C0065G0002 [Parcubacteria group bacterium GW2011_GWF2_45_11]|nr:MAG: hypothetical protein UW91_C0065G0002 [Parcubacteria group bacterium GW2011_GWF2_45_11]OGW70180.1 MAG: hypothetical protein A2036_02715 [Omnitrophica bacterium GWA2_50_21]